MRRIARFLPAVVLLSVAVRVACAQEIWTLGPFVRADSADLCLVPDTASRFLCPIRNTDVQWEAKDVFNPAAVVRDGKVYLLYRAQDRIGRPAGTSRIGLAWSEDGLHFVRRPAPVLFPDNDPMKRYEWEGGCEDPRVVQDEQGTYVMTYTAYDSRQARMAVATSADLIHWKKAGLAFADAAGGKYRDVPSKSGSIVTRKEGMQLLAARIQGRYWMYWGDWNIFLATSDDLIHWTPVEGPDGRLLSVLKPRPGSFDSRLVECGPPALLTGQGILLIYNSSNAEEGGDPRLPPHAYAAGQVLFASDSPATVLRRTTGYFFYPERSYEREGQVENVCFLEGLVFFKDRWLLYYGTADSRVAMAAASGSKR